MQKILGFMRRAIQQYDMIQQQNLDQKIQRMMGFAGEQYLQSPNPSRATHHGLPQKIYFPGASSNQLKQIEEAIELEGSDDLGGSKSDNLEKS